MDYIQLSFPVTGISREILIAHLSEAGCEGFEETDELLLASMPANQFNPEIISRIAAENSTSFTTTIIPQQNWNAIWEAGFEPVIVPGFCTIRAAFHPPAFATPYEIIITPKMSFGTGHHATTRLMIGAMKDMDFSYERVLDFGTGTGILAILAWQLGAEEVWAIDNDDWSVKNASENVSANNSDNIRVLQGSLEDIDRTPQFDIILANINRHILVQYMPILWDVIIDGGELLLSGILKDDIEIIEQSATKEGFRKAAMFSEGDWIALKFTA